MKVRHNAWTGCIAVTTALLAACSGSIDSPNQMTYEPGTSGNEDAEGNSGSGGGVDNGSGSLDNGSGGGVDNGSGGGVDNGSGGGVDNGSGDVGNGSGGGVDNGSGDPTTPAIGSECVPGTPKTSQLQRLTNAQYDNTIRDLVGLDLAPSSLLPPDASGSVDQRRWDGYRSAAETVAAEVMASPEAKASVIPCTPEGDGAACASQLVAEFGARAFRRPLTADETARYESLYTRRAELTETGTFDEAAHLIIEAFLSSPSFVTRAELNSAAEGDRFLLSPHETASRLSYLLWESMPDAELFAAADAGELASSAGILTQAQRMLQDPRARDTVASFHRRYMHMGSGTRWEVIQRDSQLFPSFDEAQVPAMSQETELFLDHVAFSGGSFSDMFTSPVAYVNAGLAPLYGLDAADFGAQLEPVELDPQTRPGILTRVGFLASHSSFNRTSPILRGAFIQKEILCTSMGTPPPGVEGTPLPTEGLTTNRERVDAQTAPQECSGCHHTVINPTGFALESYDATGAVQTTDNGAPVDTSAKVLIGGELRDLANAAELMTAIANSPEAQRCYAEKLVKYAFKRDLEAADACTVDELTSKLTNGGYTILNLITDLTQTESFRYRAPETEVAQ